MIPMVALAPAGIAGAMIGAGVFSAGSHMNSAYNRFIDAGMDPEKAKEQAVKEAKVAGAVTGVSVFL